MNYFIYALIGYLIGSIPFSYLVAKAKGKLDIREHGSKNAGATNVFRVLGKKSGILALLLDMSKGILAAFIGYRYSIEMAVFTGMFAVIGHCYPVFMKFKGGKGVATSGGMLLFVAPLEAFVLGSFMVLVIVITKYVSLASILAAVIINFIFYFKYHSIVISMPILVISILVIYRHRGNIHRLLHHEESKINFKK